MSLGHKLFYWKWTYSWHLCGTIHSSTRDRSHVQKLQAKESVMSESEKKRSCRSDQSGQTKLHGVHMQQQSKREGQQINARDCTNLIPHIGTGPITPKNGVLDMKENILDIESCNNWQRWNLQCK